MLAVQGVTLVRVMVVLLFAFLLLFGSVQRVPFLQEIIEACL